MSIQSWKRFVSLILACVMIFSVVPMGAMAETTTDEVETEVTTQETTTDEVETEETTQETGVPITDEQTTPAPMAVTDSRFDTAITGGYYNILSENDYNIISGVTETEIVMNNSDGTRRQVFRFFSINPKSSSIQLVPGYYQIDKYASDPTNKAYHNASKVTDMAAYYENKLGYDIVGGMNTALAYDSNAPYSFLMWEGQVLQDINDSFGLGYDWLNQHSGTCATYLAIKKDGSVELRSNNEPFEADDWNCIGANFGWLVKDGKLASPTVERTSAPASRSMVGIKADGTLILCQTDGRGANNSVGQSNYEMGEMMLALGCVWAFNCDGGGSSTFISQRAGESGLTMRSIPSDGSERPTLNAIFIAKAKGMTPGIFEIAQIHSGYDYFAPNTTYTFTAEAIDTTGAAMEMPEGGVWSLSDDSYGTITDGVFVSNGTLGEVAVQFTVGGKTFEKIINVVHPKSVSFGADGTVIPYGKSVTLAPTVLYGVDNWNVYYQADTFIWEFSDTTVGTWNADTLTYTATSDESKKGPTLTVTYKYSETIAPISYNIEFGKGSELVAGWDFENGDVSDWMGFSDAKAWSIANGVNNSLVGSDPLAGQFSSENDAHTFLATAENGQVKNGKYALGITYDNSDSSFRGWTYNVLFNVGEVRVFRDVANGLNATTLGFWLYIPEGAAGLAFQSQFNSNPNHVTDPTKVSCVQDHFMFTTVSGVRKNLNSCTEQDIPANRWVYASIDISKYAYLSTMPATNESNSRSPSWMRTYIKPETPAQLTFYIDDITLDYSAAVEDRNAPVISNATYTTADESIALTDDVEINGNSVGFTAAIAESTANGEISGLNLASAKIYIDGNEVETEVTKTTIATKANVNLTNGQHRVTFEIEDNWRNRTQLSYEFTIVGEKSALVELSGHNDLGNIPEADSVYYVDIKTSAAEEVAIVEAVIQLNTANTWELEHMIVAPGFEVEYIRLDDNRYSVATFSSTTDIHAVDNVISIVLTRKEGCTLTGEQTLLSIPVRVWSWNGFNNVTEKPEPAPANKPTVTIDYTMLNGYVETVAGDVNEVGGTKSVATTMIGDKVPDGYTYHEHTVIELEDKAATCTEAGYTGRTYCNGCGSVVEWGEKIEATGHRETYTGSKEATCTEDGYIDRVFCKECDATVGMGTIVEAAHTATRQEDRLVCAVCKEGITTTGLIELDGYTYYTIAGKLQNKWHQIGDDWYYFNYENYYGMNGSYSISRYFNHPVEGNFQFVNGKLVSGIWSNVDGNLRYYYGPTYYASGWETIDGQEYYFTKEGYCLTGYQSIIINPNNPKQGYQLFYFDENGVSSGLFNGFYSGNYYVDGVGTEMGMTIIDGNIYYIKAGGYVVAGCSRYVPEDAISEELKAMGYKEGMYTFDAEGKIELLNGIVDGHYYENGIRVEKGLFLYNGYIYYAKAGGWIVTNGSRYVVDEVISDELKAMGYKEGMYTFDAEGKFEIKNGIFDGHYYENGIRVEKGLFLYNGYIYYAKAGGWIVTNGSRYVVDEVISEELKAMGYKEGMYTFDAEGKFEMKNGIFDGHYYENGIRVEKGLFLYNGYIYYAKAGGWIVTNGSRYVVDEVISDELKAMGYKEGMYTFDAEGKFEIKNGIIDGHYYENGIRVEKGLFLYNGFVYFAKAGGWIVTNGSRYVADEVISEELKAMGYKAGVYTFDAEGKVVE